jgi:hypothetical protein
MPDNMQQVWKLCRCSVRPARMDDPSCMAWHTTRLEVQLCWHCKAGSCVNVSLVAWTRRRLWLRLPCCAAGRGPAQAPGHGRPE